MQAVSKVRSQPIAPPAMGTSCGLGRIWDVPGAAHYELMSTTAPGHLESEWGVSRFPSAAQNLSPCSDWKKKVEESINWNQLFSFHSAEGLQHDRTLIFRLCPGCLTAAATWHVHVPALEVLSKEFPNLSEAAVTLLSFAAQKGVLCPLPIGHNADGLH